MFFRSLLDLRFGVLPEEMMDPFEPQPVANDSARVTCQPPLKLWYAAHTRANHEKRIAEHLSRRVVEHFLPLYSSVHRWKDRRVQLQLPLFPGYIFVQIALCDRLRVLEIPGVARLVGFNGTPAALPEAEITALKAGLEGMKAAPHPYLKIGKRVRIATGPLEGLEGIVIRIKNDLRFVISLDLIQRSVAVEMDQANLELVG